MSGSARASDEVFALPKLCSFQLCTRISLQQYRSRETFSDRGIFDAPEVHQRGLLVEARIDHTDSIGLRVLECL